MVLQVVAISLKHLSIVLLGDHCGTYTMLLLHICHEIIRGLSTINSYGYKNFRKLHVKLHITIRPFWSEICDAVISETKKNSEKTYSFIYFCCTDIICGYMILSSLLLPAASVPLLLFSVCVSFVVNFSSFKFYFHPWEHISIRDV